MKTSPHPESSTVLDRVRADKTTRDQAEVALVLSVLDWAVENTVEPEESATYVEAFGDTGLALAGPGAPCVSEFAVYELAAALGMSSESGKRYLGRALEVRYRLPRAWQSVVDGDLPFWRTGTIADHTMLLPAEGADYVDRMLAPVAHQVGYAQLNRLVEEALTRFDPDQAAARRAAADEHRHFDVHTDQAGIDGVVHVEGCLDLADAVDLNAAIAQGAAHLKTLGSTDSLDVRRSIAAGDLARRQLALDLTTGQTTSTGRAVNLYVHLSDPTIARTGQQLITVDQVIGWCQTAGTTVNIRPVIDLNHRIHVDAYEIPDRIAEHVELRDLHCVFPWCTRPAKRCDKDHRIPHAAGGPTATDNIAPLCRRHHRTKTFSTWHYDSPALGTYVWTSPNGLNITVDHTGTALDP